MLLKRSMFMITDDVVAAAMVSSAWSQRGDYFVVLESPRMDRPDSSNEVIKVLNVISRVKPSMIIMHKVDPRAVNAIKQEVPVSVFETSSLDDFTNLDPINISEWQGVSDEDAINLLISKQLEVTDNAKSVLYCGREEVEVSMVIAANYAIYHSATFQKMRAEESWEKEIVADLNGIENANPAVRDIMISQLQEKIALQIPADIKLSDFDKTLIVSRGIPLGLGLTLARRFTYMQNLLLGQNLAHNIYEKEWGEHERIAPIGLFVEDRSLSLQSEYDSFTNALMRARGLPKKVSTDGHVKLTEIQLATLPYDFLYIATHGRQLQGERNTYNFIAKDKTEHSVTVDMASGELGVVIFKHSIDGVSSEDSEWSADVHKIVEIEFTERYVLERVPLPDPIKSEPVALPMRTLILGNDPREQSPLSLQRLASSQRAIVVANACGSWTDLIERFSFAGVAAYIGTLWPVSSDIAARFAVKFYEELFQKPLDECFFLAKESLSSENESLNYVMTGSFENKYDSSKLFGSNGYDEAVTRLENLLTVTQERIAHFDETTPDDIKNNTEIDEMIFQDELKGLAEALGELRANPEE